MIELFNLLFVNPTINLLLGIYQLLTTAGIPYALGFSIILLTVVIRLLLAPSTASQLRTSKKLQDIQPHLNKLKEKHKGDPKRLQQETMALYKEHGVNPLGGCLPTLIQLLLFPALYGVFNDFVTLNEAQLLEKFNNVVYFPFLRLTEIGDPSFFGLPLGKSPGQLLGEMPLILLIPLVTGVLQFLQTKMMFSSQPKPAAPVKKKEDAADFQSMLQMQMTYFFPVMVGFITFTSPLGIALYWNTFTIFAMIQQYIMHGWGGLAPWIAKIQGKKHG
jgi:YidC/Oxa1 family membrane protein insertase